MVSGRGAGADAGGIHHGPLANSVCMLSIGGGGSMIPEVGVLVVGIGG